MECFVFNQTAVHACVRRWGSHSLAYSILQPGMLYFGGPGAGVIAYRRVWGQCIVLADPVADPRYRDEILSDFLAEHPRAVFMQVTAWTAETLKARGFRASVVGVENEIAVDRYSLSGRRMQDLRHYRNKAVKGGVVVAEETDCERLREELKPVSDAWLPSKSWHQRELEFLARPYQLTPELGVRIFTARIEGRAKGFVVLDPMYEEGVCRGYVVTILRHSLDAPEGTVDYINLCVIEHLRAEGIPVLSLGVSPFHRIEELSRVHGHGRRSAYIGFKLMKHFGDPLYHFRGLSFHKSRYRAQETPVFTCLRAPVGAVPLIACARACRMI